MTFKDEKYYYSDLKSFLIKKYGKKLGKIGLTLNTPCPNNPPCTFCNATSFIPHSIKGKIGIKKQIEDSLAYLSKKYKTDSFIAYFQDNTSTFGSPQLLANSFSEATESEKIDVLAISTRSDYVSSETLNIIKENCHKKDVWIELGLQSCHDKTLKRINRNHTYTEFLTTFEKIRKESDFLIGIHLIMGLPGETYEMQLETIKEVNRIKPDYIKINHLQIVKGAALEKEYLENKYTPLNLDEYIKILADSISYLDKNIVIQRILSNAHLNELIAPKWNIPKSKFKKLLFCHMDKNNLSQGCRKL